MKKEEDITNKCPTCGRPTHKESKYCIFHASAEEKNVGEFKEALKEYVNKIKKEDGDYDFEKFIFIGDIDFKKDLNITIFKLANFTEATFEGVANFTEATFSRFAYFTEATFSRVADFTEATFEEVAYFIEATFKGLAYFKGATFSGVANLSETTFKGQADFTEATFEGVANFIGATFEEVAYFTKATFEEVAYFIEATFKVLAYFKGATFSGVANLSETTFKGQADFTEATFEEVAYFIEATFKGGANFIEATFEGDADFKLKYLIKGINLLKLKVFSGKKISINVMNGKGKISFKRAYLENIYLDIELVECVLIDFTDTLFRNTKVEKDKIKNHILQEKEKKFSKAKEIYLLLKNNFHSIGQYEDESWAYKKEKDMERKSNCHFNTLHKWLWSCFLNGIFGYGIQPSKVIMSAILIITLFSFLFMNPGISNIVGIEEITSNNFFDCLYFSTITFTTLGYGDFRPLEGLGRFLAGSEAFIGAFMMALFVYTFARRTGGR